MDTSRWQEVSDLFTTAVDLSPQQQTSFLDEKCGDDTELRSEVDIFLLADAEVRQRRFLDGGQDGIDDPLVGTDIGPYSILERIGDGGFGVVYLARREAEFNKRVALKLMKPNAKVEDVLERFHAETRTLAALRHHHSIAALLDAGQTDDGRPFLVMEYVDGQPIDTYCKTRRLSITERLKLFCSVCEGASYAHRNTIVHCDLKPTNILISSDGDVKLIDFGIARLLNPDLSGSDIAHTPQSLRAVTPQYASPEVLRGEAPTTAMDIYSLGVILYELMTLHVPYSLVGKTQQERIRMICEVEPPDPSEVVFTMTAKRGSARDVFRSDISGVTSSKHHHALLRGDIDRIVFKALNKSANDRYASAQELAEDVRRHLDNFPVLAVSPTWRYVWGKYVRRKRGSVIVASLSAVAVLAGLVAGGVGLSMGTITAINQRDATEQALSKAEVALRQVEIEKQRTSDALTQLHVAHEETKTALNWAKQAAKFAELAQESIRSSTDVTAKLQDRPGTAAIRIALLTKALSDLETLVEIQHDSPALQRTKALAILHIGGARQAFGRLSEAEADYLQARDLLRKLVDESPSSQGYYDLASANWKIGDISIKLGKADRALDCYKMAYEAANQSLKIPHDELIAQRHLGIALEKLGNIQFAMGKPHVANDYYAQALSLDIPAHLSSEQNRKAMFELVALYDRIGDFNLFSQRRPTEARGFYQKSLDLIQQLSSHDTENTRYKRSMSIAFEKLGDVTIRTKGAQASLEYYHESLRLSKDLSQSDPLNAQMKRDLSFSYNRVADAYRILGDLDLANTHYTTGLNVRRLVLELDRESVQAKGDVAFSLNRLGDLNVSRQEWESAKKFFLDALSLRREIMTSDPLNANLKRAFATSLQRIGDMELKLGELESARQSYLECKDAVDQLVILDKDSARTKRDASVIYNKIGDVYFESAELVLARECYLKALDLRKKLDRPGDNTIQNQKDVAASLERLARVDVKELHFAQAETRLNSSVEILFGLRSANRLYEDLDGDLVRQLRILATVQVSLKRFEEVTGTVDRIRELNQAEWQIMYDVACCYGECISTLKQASESDAKLREARVRTWGQLAVDALESSLALGAELTAKKMTEEMCFSGIHDLTQFQEFLKKLP